MTEYKECTMEDPFKGAREFYQNISKFFEEKANDLVLHFHLAIPCNLMNNELYVWNDTGNRPAIRIEFYVDCNEEGCNRGRIVYKVKQQKDGSYKYTVMNIGIGAKDFKDEEEALKYVTETWYKIFEQN